MTASDLPEERRTVRIGDAERNLAVEALTEHLTSGRLTLDEFTERSDAVTAPRTQDEVDRVFSDLPPTAAQLAVRGTTGVSRPAVGDPTPKRSNKRALVTSIGAAMPFIAVGLFFLFDSWVFFLLIPLWWAIIGPWINNSGDDSPSPDTDNRRLGPAD